MKVKIKGDRSSNTRNRLESYGCDLLGWSAGSWTAEISATTEADLKEGGILVTVI